MELVVCRGCWLGLGIHGAYMHELCWAFNIDFYVVMILPLQIFSRCSFTAAILPMLRISIQTSYMQILNYPCTNPPKLRIIGLDTVQSPL